MTLLLNCESISKSFGSKQLFKAISFGIFQGDHIGLIGPNGSGKSTFLKILAGLESPDTGVVSARRGTHIGYVAQECLFPQVSLEEFLLKALGPSHAHEPDAHRQVHTLLSKCGFNDPLQMADTLSGGWKKRLAIAHELIKSPQVLFLDEPTNHLDLEGILWLEKFLLKQPLTYLLVSHDRAFLQNVTNRMVELNASFSSGLFSIDTPYEEFVLKRDEYLLGQGQYERSLSSKVRREVEWLKQNPKARTTKAQSRIQEADRLIQELAEVKHRNKKTVSQIDFVSTTRETKKLGAIKNLTKSVGGRKLFEGIDLTLHPGLRLGVIGENGSGKSTFLKLLVGELEPDLGTIKYVEGVKIFHFDQHRATLPLNLTLRRALSPESDVVNYRGQSIHVNGWCQRFLFSALDLELPLEKLSGGERARALIARLMLQPADILLLDEPTNDLDIPTLEILEEALVTFPGAIVLITHDRSLIESTCNQILSLDPDQGFGFFADYAQWQAAQKEEESSPKSSKENTKPVKAKISSKKLSYKEEKELSQVQEEIVELEERILLMQQELDKPEAASDAALLQEKCATLDELQQSLERFYSRWQILEEKKNQAGE